jgi:hypothetical protein
MPIPSRRRTSTSRADLGAREVSEEISASPIGLSERHCLIGGTAPAGNQSQMGEPMKRGKQVRNLRFGEYILPVQSQNTELAAARWMLMETVSRVLPRFFEQLRDRVYPTFARLAESRPGYWERGCTMDQSDPDQQLAPALLGWARAFHAEEPLILEGALQTLGLWHRDPESRESLDIGGFRYSCCVDTLSDEDQQFTFEHYGWDPQFQRWASFRDSAIKKFQEHLAAYERRLSSSMESQGAVRVRKPYSAAYFDWFAWYQLCGWPLSVILGECPDLKGDESTILKGVKFVADLLQWKNIRNARKARKPRTRNST